MKILKSLKKLLEPKPVTELPWDLTRGELARLNALVTSDGWDTYVKLLERVSQAAAEDMLLTPSLDYMIEARGRVLGIREAATLVQRIVLEDERSVRERLQRVERTRERASRRSDAGAFFGTSYWDQRSDSVQVRR